MTNTANLTRNARRAVAKYSAAVCLEAARIHLKEGEGGAEVGRQLGLTTNQADAAISAGIELSDVLTPHAAATLAAGAL